jgi:hypothetical protein
MRMMLVKFVAGKLSEDTLLKFKKIAGKEI